MINESFIFKRRISRRISRITQNVIRNGKKRIQEHFTMRCSLGHMMEVARDFYFFSSGINEINEINDGIKDQKRNRMCILHLTFIAIFSLTLNSFLISNYLYSYLNMDIYFRLWVTIFAFGFVLIVAIKYDMISSDRKQNSSPMKVFYYLLNDLKSKHNLNESNYNKLAILSRIVQIAILDYGIPFAISIAIGLTTFIAISNRRFIWIWLVIYYTTALIISSVIISLWICMVIILFSYYKMRFDQINLQMKSILPNQEWNIIKINKRKEKQFIKLIYEHRLLCNEIHKLNLMIRRSVCFMTLFLTANRIIILYLLINFKTILILEIMTIIGFVLLFIIGFGLTLLFSLQIKSAHQSLKFVHSIFSKYKIRLKFKFKVVLFNYQ